MRTFDELKNLIEQRGVHAEFGAAGEGWGIEQNPYELAVFLVRMQELGVQSCLEIGTGYKGGLSRFLAADMGWRVTTVDVVDYGHKYEGVEYVIWPTIARYQNAKIFDLVFIDGAHDYRSVSIDYNHYSCLAIKVVAFHDIIGLRDCEGVMKFWNDLHTVGYFNSVVDPIGNPAGIGWIEL